MAAPEALAKLSGILTLASIAVVTGALYLAKGVLVPLTLAVLLSFRLSPMCDRLERRRFGRIPGCFDYGNPRLRGAGHRPVEMR